MHERFFKLKRDNPKYDEYFEWLNSLEFNKTKWKEFKKLTGIESNSFVMSTDLYIIPTENDLIKFGRFLCKENFKDGLRKFKKTSNMQKDWERFLNSQIKFINKPKILTDFMKIIVTSGKYSSRLFHYKEDVYCSIASDNTAIVDCDIPQGYEEIKGSEFYKIIETIEEEQENNG